MPRREKLIFVTLSCKTPFYEYRMLNNNANEYEGRAALIAEQYRINLIAMAKQSENGVGECV
ncbi:hypothetical protein KAM621c_16570 [Citrobacter braakii]|uniref:Uncharacterized protein n=1 Tax=Citrobacter braakii TaxID=57706 RepID=A0AAD1L167_CITBR|nr:hypothetical protein KAM621c_16570 [Citrobacter braakii]